jgi:transcriptional regulator with XRE-family HTH domain
MKNNVHSPAMKFSHLFRTTRLKFGLSIAEAAKRVGCTSRLICYWESETRTPKPSTQHGALALLTQPARKR